ncbi:hypothetical protein ACS0TY_017383 [Phlomoides rotata]
MGLARPYGGVVRPCEGELHVHLSWIMASFLVSWRATWPSWPDNDELPYDPDELHNCLGEPPSDPDELPRELGEPPSDPDELPSCLGEPPSDPDELPRELGEPPNDSDELPKSINSSIFHRRRIGVPCLPSVSHRILQLPLASLFSFSPLPPILQKLPHASTPPRLRLSDITSGAIYVTRVHEELFLPGEVIMEQGNVVDQFYFVCHVVLNRVGIGADGLEETVASLEQNNLFREISILCNIPQPYNVPSKIEKKKVNVSSIFWTCIIIM